MGECTFTLMRQQSLHLCYMHVSNQSPADGHPTCYLIRRHTTLEAEAHSTSETTQYHANLACH